MLFAIHYAGDFYVYIYRKYQALSIMYKESRHGAGRFSDCILINIPNTPDLDT